MFDWLAAKLLRIFGAVILILPETIAIMLVKGIGVIAFHVSPRKRIAYVNLKAAFPNRFDAKERKRIVRQVFVNIALNVLGIFRGKFVNQNYIDQRVQIRSMEHYQQFRE